MAACNNDEYTKFGNYVVERIDKTDGVKYFFNNDQWLMIRTSGTEPVLRIYSESSDLDGALAIIKACKEEIGV
jgi:phosphomannomutase